MSSAKDKYDNAEAGNFRPEDFRGWSHLQVLRQCQPFNLMAHEWDKISTIHKINYDNIKRKPTKKQGFKNILVGGECQRYLDYYFNNYIANLVRRHVMIRNGITSKSLMGIKNKLSAAAEELNQIATEQESRYRDFITGGALFSCEGHALIERNIFPLESINAGWKASSPNKYIAVLLEEEAAKSSITKINLRSVCNEITGITKLIDAVLPVIPKKKRGRIKDTFIDLFTGRILAVYKYSGGEDVQTANCWSFISAVVQAYIAHVREVIDKNILITLVQVDERVIERRIGDFSKKLGDTALDEFVDEIKDFREPEAMTEALKTLSLYEVPTVSAYPYSDSYQNPRSLRQMLSELNRWFPQNVQNQGWRRTKPKRRVAKIRRRFSPTHYAVSAVNASED